jgi:CubicO group peptidase (beta-lactamase class C family)
VIRQAGCVLAILAIDTTLAFTQPANPVIPGRDWERITKPEDEGYSSAKLDILRSWMKAQATKGLVVSVGGRVLFEYGDLKYVSKIASIRKSILGMLYGNYVASGKVDLQKTVKEIGIQEARPFLPIEENATLEMLLMSRSGIYFSPDENPTDMPPRPGSQYPGTFFCYQNWDFDAAGTAFEKLTGKNIYDALETDLAGPLGMQDFDRSRQKKGPGLNPEYPMYLSTRDMARIGLLMLRRGNWGGKTVIPAAWVKYLTTLTTHDTDLFPLSFRLMMLTGPVRWGFGVTWWVWDHPHFPGDVDLGPYEGAFSGMGSGGQYLTVLPNLDMVISHKVEVEGPAKGDVSIMDYSTILQMVLASRCNGPCR